MLTTRRSPTRRALALVAALAVPLAAVLTAGVHTPAAADPACGPFTGGVHVVTTADQLVAIGTGTAGNDCDPARTYRLDADITVPPRTAAVVESLFTGTFEGNNRSITLAIDRTEDDGGIVGLFRRLQGATVNGLILYGSVRTAGSGPAGALAGESDGTTTVTAISSFVDVTGREAVGGLVGSAFGGTITFSSVQVGTGADAIELRGVARVGGLVGSASSGVSITGPVTANVRALPQARTGSQTRAHGGLIGYAQSAVTVDGSVIGAPYGVDVTFELLVPDGPATDLVGGVAGWLVATDVVLRGVSVDLDVISGGGATGGLVGALLAGGATTIGGAGADAAVRVTGSIVGGQVIGDRAGGVATTHFSTGSGTTIRNLTMAAAISSNEVGGLYSNVNGTLSVESTTVSGPIEGLLSAGGVMSTVSSAQLTLRDVLIASDIRADQVGGIADGAGPLDLDLDGVELTGTLRPRAAATDGFRAVGGMFAALDDVTFTGPVDFRAVDATIAFDFPDGLAVGDAVVNVAGLVPSLAGSVDLAALSASAASAPTLAITVSDALRDSGRCRVATRFLRFVGPGNVERIDPPSPDPCPPVGGGVVGGVVDGTDPVVTSAGSGPELACTWSTLAVGAPVACTVSGGPAGAEIAWRALVNPTVAGGAVVLDGDGSGAFTFTVPRAALGGQLAVELIEWRPPTVLGTVGGAVPTSVPAGAGPLPARGAVPGGFVLLAALGLAAVLRRPLSEVARAGR